MTAFETGPFLNAAFFCERVLTEADGTNTYVRVVDRVTRQATSPERPSPLPPLQTNLTLVLLLKSGAARGIHKAALELERPSGLRAPMFEFDVNLPAQPGGGVNYHLQLVLDMDEPGTWWVDFLWGDDRRLMSRTPLELVDTWIQGFPMPGPAPQP